MLCSYKGGRVKNRSYSANMCNFFSKSGRYIYTQGIGGESVDKGEEEESNEEKFFIILHILYRYMG